MSFQARARMTGLGPYLRRVERLDKKVRNQTERKMARKMGQVVYKLARAKAPKRVRVGGITIVGTMRKAIKEVVRKSKRGTGFYCVVGPRTGMKRQIGVRIRAGKKSQPGQPIYEDPANIAHLAEFGHGGPHPAAAHPFMRPALDEGKAPAIAAAADVAREAIANA